MKAISADIIVIGGGIAGVSSAAQCAIDAQVTLVEMESRAGLHATGRSAAFFSPAYGNAVVRDLTAASERFFRDPPEGFVDVPLLRQRDCLFVGRHDQLQSLADLEAEVSLLRPVDTASIYSRVPAFRAGYLAGGLCDASGGDLDVDALHQGYLRQFRARGGQLAVDSEVQSLRRVDGQWHVRTENELYCAPLVINAAGAWADAVAARANLGPLGIEPRRRSVLLVDAPAQHDIPDWPLVVDADEAFYFKPEAGQLLLSLADETPSPACDAQPEELDLAIAIDRVSKALDIEVRRINHSWAGLRSFAPDSTFVVGEDPRAGGFFWLAGQGGYGIQSAPALAHLSAHLVTGQTPPADFAAVVDHCDSVTPARLIDA
jgi:D-arginine dehydrogenase